MTPGDAGRVIGGRCTVCGLIVEGSGIIPLLAANIADARRAESPADRFVTAVQLPDRRAANGRYGGEVFVGPEFMWRVMASYSVQLLGANPLAPAASAFGADTADDSLDARISDYWRQHSIHAPVVCPTRCNHDEMEPLPAEDIPAAHKRRDATSGGGRASPPGPLPVGLRTGRVTHAGKGLSETSGG
ncbi:hypothetical protein EJ06DRAFT_565277 [Trichodelitschia bisporula]|uniref:Uncharacterized protein n=1 Tax=Trichodelitschia bisporula TaxID=703511 RepID=A0A6G1HQK5_9PEZI|nr:hypothetical protein EJ06DRAFT_565277 [Trichodelitschia bisporula]